ncbi:hypothetical protein ASE40_11270 [Flavobacterium sp. Root935]|uniref:hypothetical protein n=1 Tax=Flavobacterium sp. Root935 TaxID=1736610 RepID=UPI00070CF305|nr:hypothetical protein [Flavobacterium sp. Root935]KRD59679.1 hypothetical protein ASE40_11270 [Flavobacterium sp. Root935]
MTDIQVEELKMDIFKQANLYLKELGQFAPFGSTILKAVVTPIGYYSDEDIIDSHKAVETLKKQLSEQLRNNLIDGGAIAFDVKANFKNSDGISENRDALCLKISRDGENWSEDYFPYLVIDGQCVWK